MQAQTPRKESTMAHRILDTSLPSSQKAQNSLFPSHTQTNFLLTTLSQPFVLYTPSSVSQLLAPFLPPPTRALLPPHPHASAPHSGMPKHKAGVVLATYEGTKVDWGTVPWAALREGLHTFQDGKKLRPIIAQYLTILYPPWTLPTPPPRPSKRRLEELATSTWEDENIATAQRSPSPPPRRRSPTPPPRRRSSTPPSQRRSPPP